MIRQAVIYFDNCVFSNLLKSEFEGLRSRFQDFPHRIAFSDVHLAEMKGNSKEAAILLKELNAVFVRNPDAANGRYHPIASLESADTERRFADYAEFEPAYEALYAMLGPLHHLMGGQREASTSRVAEATGKKIKEGVDELLASLDTEFVEIGASQRNERIDEATKTLSQIDSQEAWETIDAQLMAARQGDPMRDMSSLEKAEFVISRLDPEDKHAFMELYPKHFANKKVLSHGEVTGFAN